MSASITADRRAQHIHQNRWTHSKISLLSLSLFLSHTQMQVPDKCGHYIVDATHTLTHSYTHTLTHSHTHTLTHSHTHTLTHSLTHTLSHSLTLSHANAHTHTHSLSLSLNTHTHTQVADKCGNYGVTASSRLLKIIGLFCKRAL